MALVLAVLEFGLGGQDGELMALGLHGVLNAEQHHVLQGLHVSPGTWLGSVLLRGVCAMQQPGAVATLYSLPCPFCPSRMCDPAAALVHCSSSMGKTASRHGRAVCSLCVAVCSCVELAMTH